MTRICDLSEFLSLNELATWARAHRTHPAYLGPDLQGHAVYAATDGPAIRVYVDTTRPDPHPRPLSWESPLERLKVGR